jgi:hypothetical protein
VTSRPEPSGAPTSKLGLSIAVALLGASFVSWLRYLVGGALNVTELTPAQDLLLGLAFAASLATASLLYVRGLAWASGPPTRRLLGTAVLVHVCAALSLPLTSNDIFANLAYGRLAALGKDPALARPADLPSGDPYALLVDARWRGRVSVYGPVLNALASACARSDRFLFGFVSYKLAMLAVGLVTLLVAYGFCLTQSSRGAAAFWLVGCNPLLAWEVSGQAHNDGVMVLAATGFIWASAAKRDWLALLLITLGFAAKFAVAPLLLLYLLAVLRRSPLRGLALTLGATAMVAALFAPAWKGPATLAGPRFAAIPSSEHVVNSLGSLPLDAFGLLLPAAVGPTFMLWTFATSGLLVVLALRLAARATTREAAIRGALVFTLCFECLGMLWYEPWYATWLLPLALGCHESPLAAIVACYTVTVPLLYHPTQLYGLSTLASHGLALVLLFSHLRAQPTPAAVWSRKPRSSA